MATVKDANENDFVFVPKKMRLRKFRELTVLIEQISSPEVKTSEKIGAIERALVLCIDGFDPESTELDFEASMEVLAQFVSINKVGGTERKKSD